MAKKWQPKSFDSLTFFTLWMQLRPLKTSLLPTAKSLSCVASHITSAVRACIAAFLGTFQPAGLSEQQTGRTSSLGWEDISHFHPVQQSLRKSQTLPAPRTAIWTTQSYFQTRNHSFPCWLQVGEMQDESLLRLKKKRLFGFFSFLTN